MPLSFYQDKRIQYIHSAFLHRAFSAVGIKGCWRNVWIWERPFVEGKVKARHIYEPHFRRLTLPLRYSQENIWEERIRFMKQFKPVYINANPYLLYEFASYVRERGINDLHFKFFISSFENLHAQQRKVIEEQFQCKVYDRYACHERAVSAFECTRQNGFHVDMENSVVEIVDKDGVALPAEKSGRLITTSLHSFIFPFIRYDIGDVASLSDSLCPCGRGLQLLATIDGRASQVIRYKDKSVYQNALTSAVMSCKSIKMAQFIQENEETVSVNIVKKDGFSQDDAQKLVQYLHALIDERLRITLHFVDSICLTPMGKFPFIVPVKKEMTNEC